jgi:hypothetical protein
LSVMRPPLISFLDDAEGDIGEQWRTHSLNAKGNFTFERTVPLDRSCSVLDLRLKR